MKDELETKASIEGGAETVAKAIPMVVAVIAVFVIAIIVLVFGS